MFVFGGADDSIGLARLCAACADVVDMQIIDYPDWTTICRDGITFAQIVEEMSGIVAERVPTGEILLAGYSLGGVVAYGVALTLARQGRSIAFVGLLDSKSPGDSALPATAPVRRGWRRLTRLPHALNAESLAFNLARTSPLLQRSAPRIGAALPAESGERFAWKFKSESMITLTLRWLAEPARMAEQLDAYTVLFRTRESDETRGWAQRVPNLEIVTVEGDHSSMLSGANLTSLVDTFRARLLPALPMTATQSVG